MDQTLETPPKPLPTVDAENKTHHDQNTPPPPICNSGKNCTPDRLKVPKAFKFPERFVHYYSTSSEINVVPQCPCLSSSTSLILKCRDVLAVNEMVKTIYNLMFADILAQLIKWCHLLQEEFLLEPERAPSSCPLLLTALANKVQKYPLNLRYNFFWIIKNKIKHCAIIHFLFSFSSITRDFLLINKNNVWTLRLN